MKNALSHAMLAVLLTWLAINGWLPTRVDAAESGATSVSSGKSDYISWVDPRIESARGRWFFSTPAARPFGMVKLTPHTVNRGQGGGGYNSTVHTALGFCHLHGWMTTGLEVMPTTGGDFSVTEGEAGWKSAFDPETEIVKPGYHKLFLEKYATWVELTTTQRVGVHRYTYTKDGQADIVINLGGQAGPMKMKNGHITQVNDTQLEGYYDRTNGTWGGPPAVRIFFVIQFEKAFSNFTTYDDAEHNSTSAYVTYDNLSAGDVVQMKAGLSFTSIAGARANLAAELDHWDFDAVRDESFRIWNSWLGRIDVEGGTDAQRTKFYTDLWHVLLGRHVLNDVYGAYPDYTNGTGGNGPLKVKRLPLDAGGKPKFNMYNSDAYWLTQWNINLVWGLAWPRMLDEFCNASLQMARDGGKLPRGPCGGGYTHIMTACPATTKIVGAYMKGCYTFDPEEAFAIIKDNHSVGGSNMLGADPFYEKNGWKAGSAGRTVEMCFQDWCAAQMAKKLGKTDDYKEFMRRSAGWKNLYHPPTGLLLPKRADGRFSHTDPLSGRGWVEANAWQASWFTSHDVQGLANLMGGRDEYCRKLNFAFEQEVDHDFVHGYGAGYVSYANQPGCQNAHLFNHAGKPWLTQYWVRRVNQQAYGGTTPQLGYGGHDEDQGQMGGVSALMSMGLFSVRGTCAVDPIYEITTPVFDKITIALDDKYYSGKQFVISTENNTAENTYIQSAKLDGRTLDNAWFYHRDLADGGTLELVLGPEPNFNWGVAELPPSESPPALPVRVEPLDATLRLPVNSIQVRARVKSEGTDPVVDGGTARKAWGKLPACQNSPSQAGSSRHDAFASSVQWKLLEGDGQAEFSGPDKLETWATFDRSGTYTLQATVTGRDRVGIANPVIKVLGSPDDKGKTFDAWIADYDSIDADGRGPAHDPDGDGVANLVEKFFGGNPARADAELAPRLLKTGISENTLPRAGGSDAVAAGEGQLIQFRQSKKLSAGDFYVLEYRQSAGQDDWRLLPGVTFHQTKELADSIQTEAKLPDWLDNIRSVAIRFRVIEQPINYAPQAKVSVSSEFNNDYAGALAVDGIKGIHMGHEWSSGGEATPWIQLDWPTAVTIKAVRLFDRPNPDDHTQAGTLTFSDGSSIDVAGIADDGSMKTTVFDAKTVTWIKFQVTGGRGSNRGLSEIEALSAIAPTTHTFDLR